MIGIAYEEGVEMQHLPDDEGEEYGAVLAVVGAVVEIVLDEERFLQPEKRLS